MKIEKFVVPPLGNNSYLVWDEKTSEAIAIDPAQGSEKILETAGKNSLRIIAVVNTHYHFDHVFENAKMKRATNARVMMHADDAPYYEADEMSGGFTETKMEKTKIDVLLRDEDKINFGGESFLVLHTPGHTAGCICLYSERHRVLFTGDTLFAGTHGRVDLPGSDAAKMKESLGRLAKLPKETMVYPGHSMETAIGKEGWLVNLQF